MRLEDMVVTVQELLPGTPAQVHALLSDVQQTGGLSPENTRTVWQDEQRGVGAVFVGTNQRGDRTWDVPCTVLEDRSPDRFAWSVGNPDRPSASWSYDLTPAEGGTLVTQEFRHGPGPSFLRRAVESRPDQEEEHVAGRAAELEANMRATLRAATVVLEQDAASR